MVVVIATNCIHRVKHTLPSLFSQQYIINYLYWLYSLWLILIMLHFRYFHLLPIINFVNHIPLTYCFTLFQRNNLVKKTLAFIPRNNWATLFRLYEPFVCVECVESGGTTRFRTSKESLKKCLFGTTWTDIYIYLYHQTNNVWTLLRRVTHQYVIENLKRHIVPKKYILKHSIQNY